MIFTGNRHILIEKVEIGFGEDMQVSCITIFSKICMTIFHLERKLQYSWPYSLHLKAMFLWIMCVISLLLSSRGRWRNKNGLSWNKNSLLIKDSSWDTDFGILVLLLILSSKIKLALHSYTNSLDNISSG